jgi:hypothetical protein
MLMFFKVRISHALRRALPPKPASRCPVLPIGAEWKRKLAGGMVGILLMSPPLIGLARAQSQSAPNADPEPKQHATAKSKKKSAGNHKTTHLKVYTNADLKALPPDGVSIVGQPMKEEKAAGSDAGQTPHDSASGNADEQAAASWKARFTAARNKLDQDEKALPILQSELEYVRVQQWPADGYTGQVNSDSFMYILSQIDATKLAIEKDKQALSDLQDEFRRAGGQPGWIR